MTTQNPLPSIPLAVVCPFYNEAHLIVESVERMVGGLEKLPVDWELILVNDGSTDNGAAILVDHLRQMGDKRVRLISYPINQGRGKGLKVGIAAARGEVIVTTEIDLSWGEEIVAQLLAVLQTSEEIHFVVASPHLPDGGFREVPWQRVALTTIGNRLISLFFSSGITMHTGMTRAYRRGVIQPLQVRENSKAFHLEVLLKLIALGFRYREIPAVLSWETRNRTQRDSPYPPRPKRNKGGGHLRRAVGNHILFLAIAQPMRYFGILAGVSGLCGMAFLLEAIRRFFFTGEVAIFAVMVGLLLMTFASLFTGFAVLFIHIREIALDNWRCPYPDLDALLDWHVRQLYPEAIPEA